LKCNTQITGGFLAGATEATILYKQWRSRLQKTLSDRVTRENPQIELEQDNGLGGGLYESLTCQP
jgi:hypothetical protein